jgi:hypothetical protein
MSDCELNQNDAIYPRIDTQILRCVKWGGDKLELKEMGCVGNQNHTNIDDPSPNDLNVMYIGRSTMIHINSG